MPSSRTSSAVDERPVVRHCHCANSTVCDVGVDLGHRSLRSATCRHPQCSEPRRAPPPAFGGNGDAPRRWLARDDRHGAATPVAGHHRALRKGRRRDARAGDAAVAGSVVLSSVVERHIALHHATGFLFRKQSCLLRSYARYAEAKGDKVVRAATALDWAAQGPTAGTRHGRLEVVRRFARLTHDEDPRHEVPPPGAFGPQPPRRTPFIFTRTHIRALLKAAAALGPRGALRPKTYVTLLGLIAATGLRISEALALQLDDITTAGLVIRQTKFRKSRLVPVHTTTRRALGAYLTARENHAGDEHAVFLSEWHTGLRYPTVITTFLALVRGIGIHPGAGKRGPRIHDLRHTFAVRSLEECTGDREAVARHMLALSTYLGHAHLVDTYWYLQATPRLLADVAAQSEALATGGAR